VRSYRYLQYDVFTDRLFGGNQLAVFPDGRGLATETMQAIAKEMNFSETTFVLPAEAPGTDARLRIFTPGNEMPMAGHPTIGSTFALARTGVMTPARDGFVFGLPVGRVPVSLTWRNGELAFAWMTQQLPTFSEPIDNVRRLAAILSLPEAAITDTGLPAQIVSCGLPCLLVPVATRRQVDEAMLDRAAFNAFFAEIDTTADCVFFFTTEGANDNATAYSRMFAPELGIGEDPATGGASGPLGCYLVEHGRVASGQAGAMLSRQGVKMGRPSDIHISIGVERGKIVSVRVGGEAVLAGEGFLYVS
jgi:trans-2,3-dihydro-3-hydroxyanthranilate isomerase